MLDSKVLVQSLNEIPFYHRIAFAASCCERLLPNYQAFALVEDFGDFDLLNKALHIVWHFVEAPNVAEPQIKELIDRCTNLIPDSEDFTSIFTGMAMDAAMALVYTLESCLDGSVERIAEVGQLVLNTYDEYLQIVGAPSVEHYQVTPDLENWISSAPLILEELDKQQRDLAFLKSHPVLTESVLEELRLSSIKTGIHPIQRGLIQLAENT